MFEPIKKEQLFGQMDVLFEEVLNAVHVIQKTKHPMRLIELMEGVFTLLDKKTDKEYFYCGMILEYIVRREKITND